MAISIQSVVGNAIAGIVLAIVRPSKIGDTITIFGNTGSQRYWTAVYAVEHDSG